MPTGTRPTSVSTTRSARGTLLEGWWPPSATGGCIRTARRRRRRSCAPTSTTRSGSSAGPGPGRAARARLRSPFEHGESGPALSPRRKQGENLCTIVTTPALGRRRERFWLAPRAARYAGGCQPASAHSSPLTAELASMEADRVGDLLGADQPAQLRERQDVLGDVVLAQRAHHRRVGVAGVDEPAAHAVEHRPRS